VLSPLPTSATVHQTRREPLNMTPAEFSRTCAGQGQRARRQPPYQGAVNAHRNPRLRHR
jgi:hypothetical protein